MLMWRKAVTSYDALNEYSNENNMSWEIKYCWDRSTIFPIKKIKHIFIVKDKYDKILYVTMTLVDNLWNLQVEY
jgi:hypothetical protein